MTRFNGAATVLVGLAFVAGCAQQPKDIAPTYVSPLLYENLTCQQLVVEGQRVSARAAEVTGTQQQKASNDAVAMGVGLVLFWPALFFIKGDTQTAGEVARLKGEMDAIQQAAIAKNCGITIQTYGPQG
jgi:hypothetical protein